MGSVLTQKSMMDLIKKRKTLTEPEVRYYLVQVIDAVKYMHERRVIHRDLKLGTFFPLPHTQGTCLSAIWRSGLEILAWQLN